MRSVCRISWNSPAERPPYICAGRAETGIPLSEVRWETVDRQGWGGWVPRDGARGQGEDSAAGWGGGAGGEYPPSPPNPVPPSTQGAHPTAAHRGRHTLPLLFPKIPQNLYYQLPFRKVRQELYVLCCCFPRDEGPSERVSDDNNSCVTKMDPCRF